MNKYIWRRFRQDDITPAIMLDLVEKGFELVSVTQTYEHGTTLWFKGPATEEEITSLRRWAEHDANVVKNR